MKYAALIGLLAIGMAAILAPKIYAQGTGPLVEIVTPAEGAIITDSITNVVFASAGGAYKFQLYVDGKLSDSITLGKSKANYFVWRAGHAGTGWHVLNVKAIDPIGNWKMSDNCDVYCP